MGNACDCSVLFTDSSNNERSYGEGLTENDSPLPQHTPQRPRHRTHDSNNITAHNGIRKINFSPVTPGHNRNEPRHSHNHSPSIDDTDSSFDETELLSPIPTNGPSRMVTAEEQMWEDLRRDLRVLDANLTKDTEKLDNLPLNAAMGNSGRKATSHNSGRKATSHKGTGAGGTHPSGSDGQQGYYSGMNLGSVDMDKGDTPPSLSSRSSSVSSIGRRDIMLEAEEVLRSMDTEEKSEDSSSEEDGFWENDGMGLGLYIEEDEVSNVHDSWDQKLG